MLMVEKIVRKKKRMSEDLTSSDESLSYDVCTDTEDQYGLLPNQFEPLGEAQGLLFEEESEASRIDSSRFQVPFSIT